MDLDAVICSGQNWCNVLEFILTVLLLELTPGPNMAYLATLTLDRGRRAGLLATAGVAAGLSVHAIVAAFGLGVLISQFPLLYQALRWTGVAYLLYLAWKLWTAPAERVAVQEDPRQHGWRAFVASLMLTLANPKAILFFLALLPTVVDLATMNALTFVEISLSMALIMPVVMFSYVFLAARARQLFTTPSAVRRLNRGSGVAMASAAVVVATR